jgi:Flp pilus assembly protein TadG
VNGDVGRPLGESCRRDERGAIAIMTALVAVALFTVAALAVDLGNVWARRGTLQVQADQAALYAAESLPATDAASRHAVAEKVAYYFACHRVQGQSEVTPSIPGCSGATTSESPEISAYADDLLGSGAVTFPTTTQVHVTTPTARVDFGFGRAAGATDSLQAKSATAQVSSPGDLLPVGLSLNCLLSAVDNLPAVGTTLDGLVPLDYISPGPLTMPEESTTWPASQPTSSTITITSFTTLPTPVAAGTPATFTITGKGWGTLSTVQVWFAHGSTTQQASSLSVSLLGAVGTATGTIPPAVLAAPGSWRVKVAVKPLLGAYTWSQDDTELSVGLPGSAQTTLGCGRLLDSPRADTPSSDGRLTKNLQAGLDHALIGHPELLQIQPPSATLAGVMDAIGDAAGLFACDGALPDVGDGPDPPSTPNCVTVKNDSATSEDFTEGMLGPEGRLTCSAARPCAHGSFAIATLPGRTFNDDHFSDYVVRSNLLTSDVFFNLSAYVTQGIPVLTPQGALSPDLYSSSRFFWVPVLSAPLTPQAGGSFPILTFRPVFVTQSTPSGVAALDLVADVLGGVLSGLLGINESDHGVVMSDSQLAALRFMTIEPMSLPVVPDDYAGPSSPYLGIGPKLIRLVE